MKKNKIALVIMFVVAIFTGCSDSLKAEVDTVYVTKKNQVIGATIESFDKSYYSDTELETFVNEEVAEYQQIAGEKSLEVDHFEVVDGKANLFLNYASVKDYESFNGVRLFSGTIADALAAGYDFNVDFAKIEKATRKGNADAAEVLEKSELKVIITSESINVKTTGEIAYVSDTVTSLLDKATAIVNPETQEEGVETLSYIVYK